LVEERLKSLFGHAWIDAPLESGLDAHAKFGSNVRWRGTTISGPV
jgi:hypothetical protein